ncbi:DUF6065 family protein [Mesorhizobium sp. YR577]|uniref:DUF6065 family protein n=1 Tax=Mesorhizobium sp. YR577 TaxID=1884373 RepID=UPI001114B1BC|nr:DUF6065 family protein [Mesorhizobium sp. YR577]
MDKTDRRILSPAAFQVTWSGAGGTPSMSIRALDDKERVGRLVSSHFGHGVLTFHRGNPFYFGAQSSIVDP